MNAKDTRYDEIAIGRVVGPGELPGQIKIQTRDNRHTRVGEYLIYRTDALGQSKEVFATITSRSVVRNLPSSFLADPAIDAADIATALGLDDSLSGIEYELVANILGYFDEGLHSFVNPRINPDPNTTVYLAPNHKLRPALFAKQEGNVGSAQIGHLLLRPDIKVVIDVNEMVSTHLAILAGTGSGKSYLARVLLEELMQPYNRAAIVVFDPHGEYETLTELASSKHFQQPNYRPEVKVLRPGQDFCLNIYDLSFGDIRFLLPDISEKMSQLLEEVVKNTKNKAKGQRWAYRDLVRNIEDIIDDDSQRNASNKGTAEALRWRLNSRFKPDKKNKLFVDNGGTPLKDLFKPGQCTVIRLDGLEEREQQVAAAILLKKVYQTREKAKNGDIDGDPNNAIEYPVFALLEEAHRFAPSGEADNASTKILKTILSEGRKFGVGVGLITQRPGKLDQNVLSQCMTQFLMRIINPTDQDSVAKGVESAGRELLNELPALSKGQAIVSGVSTRTPVLFKVRTSYSQHKGASAKSAEEWLKYFDRERKLSREMQTATRGNPSAEEDEWEKM